jgi:hypothetical protein
MDGLYSKINPSKSVVIEAKNAQIEHFKSVNRQYPFLVY